MATKKSSSAAKKKAAPKKQAAKKKSTSVKKPSAIEESAALYANDDSAHASLQSAASTSSNEKSDKNESGNGVYLFLVLAGVAAIGYLGYAKYNSKKSEPTAEQTRVETPVVKVEKKPAEQIETPTAPEEAAKAAIAKFAVDKIESGKKWDEAISYCEKLGASLPSKQEFADFSKEAPKELKSDETYWTKNFANNTKAYTFSLKTGKPASAVKTEKHKVLCKN
jgi:hypothetical protein